MAKRIFEIKGVPDKEVEDVRSLLNESKIPYYETPGGNYGISMAAFWVSNDNDAAHARKVIGDYQAQFGDKQLKKAGFKVNWRLLPWGILLLVLLFWMVSLGLSR
jgi:hypothetical protein